MACSGPWTSIRSYTYSPNMHSRNWNSKRWRKRVCVPIAGSSNQPHFSENVADFLAPGSSVCNTSPATANYTAGREARRRASYRVCVHLITCCLCFHGCLSACVLNFSPQVEEECGALLYNGLQSPHCSDVHSCHQHTQPVSTCYVSVERLCTSAT